MYSSKKIIKIKTIKLLLIPLLGILLFGSTAFSESSSDVQQKIEDLSSQRATLESEVATFDSQITTLEGQIGQTESQINNLNNKIIQAEIDLKREKEILGEYLRTMYVEGQVSTIELIAKSKSFSEFMDKSEYMNTMQQNVQDSANRISDLKSSLENEKHQVEKLREQQKSAKVGLEQQRAQKDAYLTQVSSEEKAARDKLAKMLSRGTITCSGDSPVIKAKNPILKFPLNCGFISQGYGMTEFAKEGNYRNITTGELQKHNGIDVGVGANTGIHPAGNGTVYATGEGYQGKWGNWIIIDHHNGFYSLYAHMISPAFFSKGDNVTTDDVIGGVGGTPIWPVHLHFSLFQEIPSGWNNGSPGSYPGNTVDPLNYMNITISTGGTDWDSGHAH
jgi:murein DD-endopeptidase MepM/ murein hydrolase activator NlpD